MADGALAKSSGIRRAWCIRDPALSDQSEKAERFRQLHKGPKALILPNAWDVASARLFEEAGTGDIPRIGENEGLRSLVELTEPFCLFRLVAQGWIPDTPGSTYS